MIKIESHLNWGQECIDTITGFKGKVVAITKWQNGCIRIGLRAKINESGKYPEAEWFDEADLLPIEKIAQKGPGGPRENPKQNINPKY